MGALYIHTIKKAQSLMHACINTYIQTLHMYIHNVTNIYADADKNIHTHTHTHTHQPDIALSNVTQQTGGLRSIH
jgi:hypothetical protein